jgi:hypothetical protein
VRKCNLVDGRTSFFSTLTKLEIVYVAIIDTWFMAKPTDSFSSSSNLENNKLTKIPPELLQLRSVKQVYVEKRSTRSLRYFEGSQRLRPPCVKVLGRQSNHERDDH